MVEDFLDIIETRRDICDLQKPRSYGEKIQFPEDVAGLTTEGLGQLMMKLTAHRGYALYQLSITDVRYAGVKSLYEDEYRKVTSVLDTNKKTRVTVQQEALDASKELRDLKELMDRLAAEVGLLDRLQKIYEIQITSLSRELSRRHMEMEKSKISPGM